MSVIFQQDTVLEHYVNIIAVDNSSIIFAELQYS